MPSKTSKINVYNYLTKASKKKELYMDILVSDIIENSQNSRNVFLFNKSGALTANARDA